MFIGDQLGLANSDVFGQGILEIGQGKVSEKSGNFTFYILWEPCFCECYKVCHGDTYPSLVKNGN